MLFKKKLLKVWRAFIFASKEAEGRFLLSISKDTFKNVIPLHNHSLVVACSCNDVKLLVNDVTPLGPQIFTFALN